MNLARPDELRFRSLKGNCLCIASIILNDSIPIFSSINIALVSIRSIAAAEYQKKKKVQKCYLYGPLEERVTAFRLVRVTL